MSEQAHLLLLDGELVLPGRLERRGQQLALPIALPARARRPTPVQPIHKTRINVSHSNVHMFSNV